MRTRAGLWIDHRKAIVVAVTDKGEETALVVSKVERHPTVLVIRLVRGAMSRRRCRQMTSASAC